MGFVFSGGVKVHGAEGAVTVLEFLDFFDACRAKLNANTKLIN